MVEIFAHARYCTGVGVLDYSVKKRPDLAVVWRFVCLGNPLSYTGVPGRHSQSLSYMVFSNAVKDEKDTPTNFSKKATSEAIADEVQCQMCTNNFQKRSIKTNR
ncbi:hypothetical protein T265_04407 [Opisthorchis viverrini]|uniref:Uncharacterized protein n=1 Tax=Opisthorchis viverrini TaxID=6198 RepID=A0A074ZP22_OPIVI|nr:hypothetical protein T265_04407 [Opisthorchis viverrini]KER28866.1 hypothetical protein T265_04407 [Opisthorchis viverrini]